MSDVGSGLEFAASLVLPEDLARPPSGTAGSGATGSPQQRWLAAVSAGATAPELLRHVARRTAVRGRRAGPSLTVPVRPASLRSGPRAALRRWLLSGVVVLPAEGGFPAPGSPLHRVVAEAGLTLPEATFWSGSGGSLVAPALLGSTPVVLRVFPEAAEERHTHAQRTLRHLEAHAVRRVPRPMGSGETHGLLWLVESRLPGRRPRRQSTRLRSQVLDFCVDLPADGLPAVAPAERIPDVLDPGILVRLRRLGHGAATVWSGEPPVGTHGDLWEGNVLESGSGLSGVVDWDAYRSDEVPGTDLVHLVATAERLRHHRSMGAELLTRPWSREPLRALASAYFRRLGLGMNEDRWSAVGVAWWLGQLTDTLQRTPELARDEAWLQRNVLAVLTAYE